MTVDTIRITTLIRNRIKADGLTPHPRSKVYNPVALTELTKTVAAKLEAQGRGSQAEVEQAMVSVTPHLCASWRGLEENSNWIVEKYIASGLRPDDDDTNNGENHNDPTVHDDPVPAPGPVPDPVPTPGPVPDPVPTPNPSPVPDPVPTPVPSPVPVPPVPPHEDMPDTDDYEPPELWFKVVRIIRWNLAHPGEEKNIMLVGPAGIGKTKLAFEVSKKFFHKKPYAITAPQMEFKICGFNDAMGREVKTPVTRGYVDQDGAIVLIDEIDRMEANAGIALNMATANKSMDTPNGMIEQAPGVTFIATANTSGTGATNDFNTANQLDKSTRDRWVYLLMKWDHKVALKVSRGDEALVKGLEDWNDACDKMQYTSGLVSYRTITDILDLMDMGCFTFEECIQAAMLKYAIPKSNLAPIYDAMSDHFNKVAKAVKKIMSDMSDNDNLY